MDDRIIGKQAISVVIYNEITCKNDIMNVILLDPAEIYPQIDEFLMTAQTISGQWWDFWNVNGVVCGYCAADYEEPDNDCESVD